MTLESSSESVKAAIERAEKAERELSAAHDGNARMAKQLIAAIDARDAAESALAEAKRERAVSEAEWVARLNLCQERGGELLAEERRLGIERREQIRVNLEAALVELRQMGDRDGAIADINAAIRLLLGAEAQ